MAKSIREDASCRILRTTCSVWFGGDVQHTILVICRVHFNTCNTIAATTDIWNTILTTHPHSEGVVHDNTSTCSIREADFYDFNLITSIGGCVTTTAVTSPILVAMIGRFSYDFRVIVATHYGGEDFKFMHHVEDYIVFL